MHKKIVSTCSPNNNMYWVCIQYIVKKFPDGLFLVTPKVPIRDICDYTFMYRRQKKLNLLSGALVIGRYNSWTWLIEPSDMNCLFSPYERLNPTVVKWRSNLRTNDDPVRPYSFTENIGHFDWAAEANVILTAPNILTQFLHNIRH